MSSQALLQDAERRSLRYLDSVGDRRVFPDPASIAALADFDEPLSEAGMDASNTLALLDELGTPGTVTSNGPNYFGFVIGGSLPVADASERLTLAWDQCASSALNSPTAAKIESVAGRWILEILDLPRQSAVSFGTSASACSLACIATARRELLDKAGWDMARLGINGAPELRVVVSQTVHITLLKALRILGFGTEQIVYAPIDQHGRIDPDRLPALNDRTILCVQAGEVNTGEYDPFVPLIQKAHAAGSWVHIDGAFGLWARAGNRTRSLCEGIEQADSWTTDGHKWLNTPYDGAIAICKDGNALAQAMNSDAAYSNSSADSQKNLGLEFSRRARGIPIWAVLRTLGRNGVANMIEQHCALATRLAKGLAKAGFVIHNRVLLNQVLVSLDTDARTDALRELACASGKIWFGPSQWQGQRVFRLSVSSWRTKIEHIDQAIDLLTDIKSRLP